MHPTLILALPPRLLAPTTVHSYINLGRSNTERQCDIEILLHAGKIKNAAWDVIRDEAIFKRLKTEFGERVYLTPHIASFNESHWEASFELSLGNLSLYFQGKIHDMRNVCYV